MRFVEIINEGVVEKGTGMLAYIMVIAEQYKALPKYDADEAWRWALLAKHDDTMTKRIMAGTAVEFVNNDPYKNQREMMYDILVNGRMKIYATQPDEGQEGAHPAMTPVENDYFRAVHDFLGHYAPNMKAFRNFLEKNNIKSTGDKLFKEYRFDRNSLTVRGEMGTFVTHSRMVPPDGIPALFTEIIGQICTYFVTGNYTENKVAVMNGVDFKNVGMFTDPQLEKRKQYFKALLDDESVKNVETSAGTINKDKVRWNLLSRGEGQVRK